MYEFSGYFHNVVTDVSISARMQEECDVLCLQIAKVAKGTVNLAEYMLCMRASLRSLLPKGWSTVREVAWTWLWEDVERLLLRNIGNPLVWERRLAKLFPGIDEQQKCELRAAIHTRFFALTPAGKDCFKQSNTYLHVTADKVLDVTVTFFREPVKIIDEISALGLRHVGYDTPIELFIPFVWACVEVVSTACPDGEMIVSFRWPLGLVAKVMQRTITEGSTIVMEAIDTYSVEQLREAIQYAADHHRGLDDRGEGHRHKQRRATAGGVPMRAPGRARALDVEGPGRHAEHHAALLVRQERGARVRLCHHLRLPNLPGGPRQVLLRSGRALRAALGHRQDAL